MILLLKILHLLLLPTGRSIKLIAKNYSHLQVHPMRALWYYSLLIIIVYCSYTRLSFLQPAPPNWPLTRLVYNIVCHLWLVLCARIKGWTCRAVPLMTGFLSFLLCCIHANRPPVRKSESVPTHRSWQLAPPTVCSPSHRFPALSRQLRCCLTDRLVSRQPMGFRNRRLARMAVSAPSLPPSGSSDRGSSKSPVRPSQYRCHFGSHL